MNYSYDAEVADTIKINILEYFNNFTGVYSIKMDEIAIVSRIRWSTDNNEVIGFCFNHQDNLKMQFNNILSLTKLKEAFDSRDQKRKIHFAKEALCITIGAMRAEDNIPKPIILLPICCKTLPILKTIIKTIKEVFIEKNPSAVLLNLATDGDPYRRTLLTSLRQPSGLLDSLDYFNSDLMFGEISINFDVKHLLKRLRGILISNCRQMCLVKRKISKSSISSLYPSLSYLLNPVDKQNVPYAVLLFKELSSSVPVTNPLSHYILAEIECLNEIVKPLLNIFVTPTINLFDQFNVNVNELKTIWDHGYTKAYDYLTGNGFCSDDLSVGSPMVNMLNPIEPSTKQSQIRSNQEDEEEEEELIDELSEETVADSIESNISDALITTEASKFKTTVEYDGNVYF